MPKQNYLCIQRSHPVEGEKPAPPSPAQMEAMYAKFNEWKETFKENIVDMGGKLGAGKLVAADSPSDSPSDNPTDRPTDGPFAETKEVIGGYMIVSAESLEEAERVVREMPGVVGPGSSVEVREITTS